MYVSYERSYSFCCSERSVPFLLLGSLTTPGSDQLPATYGSCSSQTLVLQTLAPCPCIVNGTTLTDHVFTTASVCKPIGIRPAGITDHLDTLQASRRPRSAEAAHGGAAGVCPLRRPLGARSRRDDPVPETSSAC